MWRFFLMWLALAMAVCGVLASLDADMLSAILFAIAAAGCAGLASIAPTDQ